MGIVGGALGYHLLKSISKDGARAARSLDGSAYANKSKLDTLLGPWLWQEIRGKTVLDFGCGSGVEAVELAKRGARGVVGVDVQEKRLAEARIRATEAGVEDRCLFTPDPTGPVDVIICLDAFEHFADPAGVLQAMHGLLKPDGFVAASFGPTWYHPLGGHLFSVFPWAHLVFTERALIRWRSDFKTDGATRFSEVDGGLNQMTIGRFEQLVVRSPLQFAQLEAVPMRKLRLVASRWTRELTTAIVRCKLVRRA